MEGGWFSKCGSRLSASQFFYNCARASRSEGDWFSIRGSRFNAAHICCISFTDSGRFIVNTWFSLLAPGASVFKH
eukprot:5322278-Pyramimonas_sp.AAC.1